MNNLIKIGSLIYEKEAVNPSTGWVQVKNQNATLFWLPEELVRECERIHITAVKGTENRLATLRTQVDDLRRKNDSQRKSIAYYKTERDTYKRITDEECAKHQATKNWMTEEVNNQIEQKEVYRLECLDAEEQLESLKRKHQFMTTCATVIIGTLVLMLILIR
jgi:hypothetical protein